MIRPETMTALYSRLRPPMTEAFSTPIGPAGITRSPCRVGETLFASAGFVLAAIDSATGAVRWRRKMTAAIEQLAATALGPVIGFTVDGDTRLLAFDPEGEERWSLCRHWAVGSGNLRGGTDRLIIVGRDHGTTTVRVCRLLDPNSGEITLEFPCDGDCPEPVGSGFVYSVGGGTKEQNGLFRVDAATGQSRRLRTEPHTLRAIGDGMVVIDTYSEEAPQSHLVAVDPLDGHTLWEAVGGPNVAFAVESEQVAAVELVGPKRVRPVLRDSRTGKPIWYGEEACAQYVTNLLAVDVALFWFDKATLCIYDRTSGKRLETRAYRSSVTPDGLLTPTGLAVIQRDRETTRILCLRGTEPSKPTAEPLPLTQVDSLEPSLAGRPRPWTDGYVVAVAFGLIFHLRPVWHRLTDCDPGLRRDDIQPILDEIRAHGVEIDRLMPAIIAERHGERIAARVTAAIAQLFHYVERIRRAGARVFAGPAELPLRIMCTLPFPREYEGVPDPRLIPAHEIQIVDAGGNTEGDVDWLVRSRIGGFSRLEALYLSQRELGLEPLNIDLGGLACLRLIDLTYNDLTRLPDELLACRHLEWLDVGNNPLAPQALEPLSKLNALRYLRVGATQADQRTIDRLAQALPNCMIRSD